MKQNKRYSFMLSFRLVFAGLLLLTFTVSLAPPRAALADPGSGTGPGGVGNRLGTSTLELWLRADAPGYQQTDCSTAVTTDGQRVGCWPDWSGSGNDVIAPGSDNRPTFESDAGNMQNGKPVLQFGNVGGINRYLQRDVNPNISDQSFTLITLAVRDIFMASDSGVFASANAIGANTFELSSGVPLGTCSGQYRLQYDDPGGTSRSPCAGTLGGFFTITPRIVSVRVADNTNISTWNNGSVVIDDQTTNLFRPLFDYLRVGMERSGTVWPNDIAEVILYYDVLNITQRRLVENYLQAKYNDSATNTLTIGTNDRYDGDTTANGNFDLDVAGIGRESATDTHPRGHSAGMIIENGTTSFLNNTGDYLMFGHKDLTNVDISSDLPAGWGANARRWQRHWFIDVTDAGTTGGTVNIIFNFDEGGVLITPGGSTSNYRLLRRALQTGQFTDIATASSYDTVARTVTFNGVDVTQLGSNFTLGTLDYTASPIGNAPTAVTMLDMATAAMPGGARVTWTTALEIDTVLFKVQRSEAENGERILVQEVLPQGTGISGASYVVEDRGLLPGQTYYYWLEVVNVERVETFALTPVTTWSSSIFLPVMIR